MRVRPRAFFYAEVEFDTLEQARAFVPPACLGRDVTEEPGLVDGRLLGKNQNASIKQAIGG